MWGAIAKGVGGALVGEVAVNLALNTKGFNKDVSNTIKKTESGFGSAFGKIAKLAVATFSVAKVVEFGKASVTAASEAQSAWTGLYSIVDGTGKSFKEAKTFIDEYISDGLVPLNNATTAYKNLAARGYSTEQIEKVMTALKDSASFGRQASYTLGDAVQTATEGLKNENSILVDNAGVTKNVAKMWDEYAKSIGTTANNLTQEQKIQAEYNGIIEETKFQTGDAAAYSNTFAGRVSKLSTAFLNLKVAVGKVVGPIVSAFIPAITRAMDALTRFFNKIQQVMSAFGLKWQEVVTKDTTSGIDGIGSSADSASSSIDGIGDSASSTAKKLKRAFGSMDEINQLNFGDSSNGSSGSGSSGGSTGSDSVIGGFDNTIAEDPISPQIEKIADRIKKYLKPLQEINLDNLINSFGKLKKAAQPLKEKLFSGLDWLYKNVLVPFAKWTIEDAIPAFFDMLAGALTLFNGAMDYAKPYLQYLWEEFLEPIAKWTGGVIVSTLEKMGDRMSKIGKWLSDNAPTIHDVKEDLGPFANLIEQVAKFLGKIIDLAWEDFEKNMSDLWTYALKPIWTYLLEPIFTQYWSKLSGLASILGGIFGMMNKLMEGDWEGAGISILDGLTDGLKEMWEGSWVKNYLVDPLVNGFKELLGINSASTVFTEFGKNILEGLIIGILGEKIDFTKAWAIVESWFTDINVNVYTWFRTKLSDVQSWWNNVQSWWGDRSLQVSNWFSTTWSDVQSWWNNKVVPWWGDKSLKVSNWLATSWTTVNNWWNNVLGWWGTKTLEIKVKIGEVVGSIKSWFNTNLIDKLNAKLPSFIPKIPRLAQGGWVAANNPQLALIGDNTREGEIVTPESKIYDQVSKAIKDSGGVGQQEIALTLYVKYEDGKTIIQKVNQAQIDAGKILLIN